MSTDCFFPKTIISPWRLLSISLSFSIFRSVSLFESHSFTSQYHWDWIKSCCFSQGIYCEKIQWNISLRRSSLCYCVCVTNLFVWVNTFLLRTDDFQIVINVFLFMLDRDVCLVKLALVIIIPYICIMMQSMQYMCFYAALVVNGKMRGVDMNSDL